MRFRFDHFDWIAPIYDRIIPRAQIETLIQYGKFPTEGRVLEVGGGTGRIVQEMNQIQTQIFVLDSSLGMLRVAQSKLAVNLVLGMAEHLPFAEESFERVILIDTLHHVVDAHQTLSECLRVLRKDGLLLIQEPDIHQWGGKLICALEKLLLMRSRLLSTDEINSMLSPLASEVTVYLGQHQYWIICRK
ncbi:MAG: class I SAM-dependent methyltransferase [Anaerolineales bacterium]|nr:class I SAM-dependent methyltransferase [Anaerolineales bacterium]MDW8160883.1 class I SAM-dependent methyltransferase [Anaerolineales bacterium]